MLFFYYLIISFLFFLLFNYYFLYYVNFNDEKMKMLRKIKNIYLTKGRGCSISFSTLANLSSGNFRGSLCSSFACIIKALKIAYYKITNFRKLHQKISKISFTGNFEHISTLENREIYLQNLSSPCGTYTL